MSELERYWSPEPVYGYKYYRELDPNSYQSAINGTILSRNEVHDFRCLFKVESGSPLSESTFCCPKCGTRATHRERTCVGEWPDVVHGEIHGNCACSITNITPPCGFYAYRLDSGERTYAAHTYEHMISPSYAMVLVALSGLVVEHERGYRASRLTIIDSMRIRDRYPFTNGIAVDADIDAQRRRWLEERYGE